MEPRGLLSAAWVGSGCPLLQGMPPSYTKVKKNSAYDDSLLAVLATPELSPKAPVPASLMYVERVKTVAGFLVCRSDDIAG